jgi:hypothetical protein
MGNPPSIGTSQSFSQKISFSKKIIPPLGSGGKPAAALPLLFWCKTTKGSLNSNLFICAVAISQFDN